MEMLVVNKVQDIKNLPWMGNAHSDMRCFKAVDDYIKQPTTTYEEARSAVWMMGIHGMGEVSVVSDQELDGMLAEHPEGPITKSKVGCQLLRQIGYAFEAFAYQPQFHPMIEKIKIALVKGDLDLLVAGIREEANVVGEREANLMLHSMQFKLGIISGNEFKDKMRADLV